jgi:hypothetical protein
VPALQGCETLGGNMEICKNKSSNRYFIYIEETGSAEALLVTPEAQVKSLKIDLFGQVEEQEEPYLLKNKLVTEAQVQRFKEYKENRSDEVVDSVLILFEQMGPSEKNLILQKLQNMADKK